MSGKYYIVIASNMKFVLAAIVTMLQDGLNEIGIDSQIVDEVPYKSDHRSIILGANFIEEIRFVEFHPDSIIFNVENVAANFINESYKRSLRAFSVWDYNEDNAKALTRIIGRPVYYLKSFYVPRLNRKILASSHDIDVLFYGSFNKRRQDIISALLQKNIRVEAVFNVFGPELDSLISRAKIVLNLHFYDNGHTEMIRIMDLLANGKAVVTELNPGESLDDDLTDAVLAVPYQSIVASIEELICDDNYINCLSERGHNIFKQRTAPTVLKPAIEASDRPRLPATISLGCGRLFNRRHLCIDRVDRWRPDLIVDMSSADIFGQNFDSLRFGQIRLGRELFDCVEAFYSLNKFSDLVQVMSNIMELLSDGGTLRIKVPYDLSRGAWQDPTHVRAFNENSWIYYCEWHWYIGWNESRFDLIEIRYIYSNLGNELSNGGASQEEVLRTPRAVDEMDLTLRKRRLTAHEQYVGRSLHGDGENPI